MKSVLSYIADSELVKRSQTIQGADDDRPSFDQDKHYLMLGYTRLITTPL
jgi:hypothetical protein